MADKISKERRRKNMQAIRSKDTKPEIIVRKLVYSLGYRYRLHRKDLPGKPDLVFPGRKKVIYVHGCFWHQHNDPDCKIARLPKSNLEFWVPKLEKTKVRDQENIKKINHMGREEFVIWECELKDLDQLKIRIKYFLDNEKGDLNGN